MALKGSVVLQPLLLMIKQMWEYKNIPHHVVYIESLATADHCLKLLEQMGYADNAYVIRLSSVVLRFRRKCYLVKFSDETAPHHCRICTVPTGTSFRVCSDCMAAGHIRPRTDVSQGNNVARPEPRPRLSAGSRAPATTSSQRFLNRFSAPRKGGVLTTSPRAMKNRFSEPLQLLLLEVQGDLFAFPPAYVPSPKVGRGAFLRVAVLVTPPLSPMGGTPDHFSLSPRTAGEAK